MQMVGDFSKPPARVRAVPAARWKAKREGIELSFVKGSGPAGVILPRDVEKFRVTRKAGVIAFREQNIRASSLARKLAEKRGIPLEAIEGTGRRGRIMMGDVVQATKREEAVEGEKGIFGKTIPMSQMRKVISRRMVQSAFTAPHIYFFTDVEMDKLNQFRDKVLPEFENQFKIRISFNDFFIKAVALNLREFPMLNAMVRGEEIYVMPDINVGLAVATEEGLIVPAIPQADRLNLGKIAQMRTDLVERTRARKLKLEEIERGTFTISSLAQFDITFFTAILNPPQSGILTIGKTCDHLSLEDGRVIVKKIAHFGLSVDHRIVDGAVAAAFLQSLKNKLENPAFTFKNV